MMMKQRFMKPGLACLLVVLGGCAQMGGQPLDYTDQYWLKPGQARPTGAPGSLLLYYEYARNLSPADYTQELERVRSGAEGGKSAYRTLQYALALSVPGGDTRKAQNVLDNMAKENNSAMPELIALASLLTNDLAERRRLEAEAKRFESDAKKAESESKRADAEAKKVEVETKRAEAETKRADELQKKLEALKNIEKNIIQHKKLRGDK